MGSLFLSPACDIAGMRPRPREGPRSPGGGAIPAPGAVRRHLAAL